MQTYFGFFIWLLNYSPEKFSRARHLHWPVVKIRSNSTNVFSFNCSAWSLSLSSVSLRSERTFVSSTSWTESSMSWAMYVYRLNTEAISLSFSDRVVCKRMACSVNVVFFIETIQFWHFSSFIHGQTKRTSIKGENISDRWIVKNVV